MKLVNRLLTILTLCSLSSLNLFSAIISVDHWVKKDQQGNIIHHVIFFGDRHTYYSEYEKEEEKMQLTALETNYQILVKDFAQRHNATVLIEDPFSSWWHLPRYVLTKILWSNHDNDAASWLKGLLTYCKKHNVTSASIEARNEAFTATVVGGFHTTTLLLVLQALQYDTRLAKELYKHYKYVLAWLGLSITSTTLPLGAMYYKNYQLDKKIDRLDCGSQLREYIASIKENYAAEHGSWATQKFGWTVDLEALLHILEPKPVGTKPVDVVCAGYYHTNNIIQFLKTQGYELNMSEVDMEYMKRAWFFNQLGINTCINLTEPFDIRNIIQKIKTSMY